MVVLADTSFILAAINRSDAKHIDCLAVLRQYEDIGVPQSVLNEVCFMLARSGGNRASGSFLQNLPTSKYTILPLETADLHRTGEFLLKYADARADYVDFTIVAVAERLNITTILTLDQRDFTVIRPRHAEYFTLLPEPSSS